MMFRSEKVFVVWLSLLVFLAGCQSSIPPLSSTSHLPSTNSSPELVKSIYFKGCPSFQEITKTLEAYGANAVVIDVKDDKGRLLSDLSVTHNEKNRFVRRKNFKTLIKKLKERKIYTIARIVALKEPVRSDLCVKNEDGSVKIDKEKMSWMDPSNEKVQRYLDEICTGAIKIGFDEVQLDYIRFSSYFRLHEKDKLNEKSDEKSEEKVAENCASDRSRINAINNLIEKIGESVRKLGGKISVCVFGCTIEGSVDTSDKKNLTAKSSEILGQDYVEIAEKADYICPMIYPSHYQKYTPCGIENPDLEPYKTVKICMKLSNNMLKNAAKENLKTKVRPYLQAFTAKWLKNHLLYGKIEIDEQIKAVHDSGATNQWGIFNMAGKYP